MTTFKSLGLHEQVIRGVLEEGYHTPTPIQNAAIPIAASGADLTGCAQTGTGKTAAFVLPMLDRLLAKPTRSGGRHVRALVVLPTRELALQVEQSVRRYGRHTGLQSVAIFGGVGMEPQVRALRRGVEIAIATPGRLLDHVGRGSIDLSRVEILVLDEADRMFEMGFIKDVRRIVAELPQHRQTLLFSATMPPEIESLARSVQRNPQRVEIGERRNPAASVTQAFYRVANNEKMDLLLHILKTEDAESILVFSKTKHRADRIARKLEQRGIRAAAIHGNRTQGQRERALEGFRKGSFQVLVATDIASRGIDVEGVSHVINFDTPNQADSYIHRIGRTGRAESTGDAITFVSHDEEPYMKQIERFVGRRFQRDSYPGFVFDSEAAQAAPRPMAARPRGATERVGGGGGGARPRRSRNSRPGGRRRR